MTGPFCWGLITLGLMGATAGAPPQNGTRRGEQAANRLDACSLISKSVLEKLQAEPLIGTKPSSTTDKGVMISQCFYWFATSANSISLSVTLPNPADASQRTTRELWNEWFHETGPPEKKNEGDARPPRGEAKEEEEGSPPQAISGIGDEAYWSRRFVGTLYVLKGNAVVRISIGGKQDDANRLRKAKILAKEALSKLP